MRCCLRYGLPWLVPLVLAGCRLVHPCQPAYYTPSVERAGRSALGEAAPSQTSAEHIRIVLPGLAPARTVADFERATPHDIPLSEALRIALCNAEVVRAIAGPGLTAPVSTIYDPRIVETQVQDALGAFDSVMRSSMFWERQQGASSIPFPGFVDSPDPARLANFSYSLGRRFTTGAEARINFDNGNLFRRDLESAPFDVTTIDEQHLELTVNQPVLRGAGVAFNRAPMVIARAQADQSVWEFKRAAMQLVRDVETTYWELEAAQVALRAVDEVLPLAVEIVRVQETRLEQKVTVAADVALARSQLEEFHQQRIQVVTEMMDREAMLRNLLGLPPVDDGRLVATESPTRARVLFDWSAAVEIAIARRPDVVRQRLAVRAQETAWMRARNGLLPQLDLRARYRANNFQTRLHGPEEFGVLDAFPDWQLGLQFEVPLEGNQAAAAAREAEYMLARERALLRQAVHATTHELNYWLQTIDSTYEQFQRVEQRIAQATVWRDGARARFENPRLGTDLLVALDTYLRSLDAWARATTDYQRLLAQYSSALARLRETQGVLLEDCNIIVLDDPTGRVALSANAIRPVGAGAN